MRLWTVPSKTQNFDRAQGTICVLCRALGSKQGPHATGFATPVQEDEAEAEDTFSWNIEEEMEGNQLKEHHLAALARLTVSGNRFSTTGDWFLLFPQARSCAEGLHINMLKKGSSLWHGCNSMGSFLGSIFIPIIPFMATLKCGACPAGAAEAKPGSKQAPVKAQAKSTQPGNTQPISSSKERMDAEAVFRGADAAFGGVPPRAVPVSSSSSSSAAAGVPLQPQQNRAPLAPAPEVCYSSILQYTVLVCHRYLVLCPSNVLLDLKIIERLLG